MIMVSPYQSHRSNWLGCQRCPLWETRTAVCLARGRVPADVLFIGEAPGASEDVLGKPFAGPAGKLLDTIIEEGFAGTNLSVCLTNLVGCIPIGDEGKKIAEPDEQCILECRPRLYELISLVKPKGLVLVGRLAEKWVPEDMLAEVKLGAVVSILHPAAILRADISQQSLGMRRCIAALEELAAVLLKK